MPTIFAHPAVAAALAPWFPRTCDRIAVVACGMACTIVPDLDVVGFRFGVAYGSPFGHRGFTHSLLFAALLAIPLAAALTRRAPRTAAFATFAYLFLCAASHGLLDAATNGGLGIALFAPFDPGRYFLPWRPIVVSPIGASGFFTGRGWITIVSELRWVVLPAAVVFATGWLLRAARKAQDRG